MCYFSLNLQDNHSACKFLHSVSIREGLSDLKIAAAAWAKFFCALRYSFQSFNRLATGNFGRYLIGTLFDRNAVYPWLKKLVMKNLSDYEDYRESVIYLQIIISCNIEQ